MELRHLRYFVVLADELSFTAAAQKLNMSQPPLSQQIRDLEYELKTELFRRNSRQVELTAAGHAFRRHALAILAQTRQAAAQVRAIGQGRAGIINVATTNSVLLSGLSVAIAEFQQLHPDVEITIDELPPQEQIEALKARRGDICFLRLAPSDRDLVVRRVWSERIGLAVPAGHPLAARKTTTIEALKDEDFVFYRMRDSAFAAHLYSFCAQLGFLPRIVQQVVESMSIASLVSAGLGIGFVPESVGRQSLPNLRYLRITGPCPAGDVHAVTQKDADPIIDQFVAFVAERRAD